MHIRFTDIVNQIAKGGWGRDFKSRDEAAKAIMAAVRHEYGCRSWRDEYNVDVDRITRAVVS